VKDDETLRGAVVYWLKRKGLHVDTASDGRSALAIALDKQPDLMVLELMIPQLDGGEVLRGLGSKPTSSVLVLTALDDDEHKVGSVLAWASDYLTKPFRMRELSPAAHLARCWVRIEERRSDRALALTERSDPLYAPSSCRHSVSLCSLCTRNTAR